MLLRTLYSFLLISFVGLNYLFAQSNHSDVAEYIPVGLYFGDITEGARIITFVRLYPEDHPDAMGHSYPTAFVLHMSEVNLLNQMGKHLGWNLYATLHRFPDPPITDWKFDEFQPPPVNEFSNANVIEKDLENDIPGLKILACYKENPIAYIIDTRNLTLTERGMTRATSSGLDIPRNKFEQHVIKICKSESGYKAVYIISK